MIELIKSARKCLELSEVKPGDKVVIWTDSRGDADYNNAFFGAALSLDADPLMLIGTQTKDMNVPPPDIAVDLLKKADLVLDIASNSWLYTLQYASILNSGVSVIQVGMTSKKSLANRVPTREIGEKAKRITSFIKESKRIRITSDLGTDLEIVEPGRPWRYFVGYIIKPDHTYDSLGAQGVWVYPKVGTVNGTVVVDGLVFIPPPSFVPKEPIRFTVEKSKIAKIEGGAEAKNLEAFFESLNDPSSYLFAHLGFGLDPRVGKADTTFDAESREGQMDVAFGSSILPIGGGDVAAKAHCDMLLDANLIVDDKLIVDKGKILYEKMK